MNSSNILVIEDIIQRVMAVARRHFFGSSGHRIYQPPDSLARLAIVHTCARKLMCRKLLPAVLRVHRKMVLANPGDNLG